MALLGGVPEAGEGVLADPAGSFFEGGVDDGAGFGGEEPVVAVAAGVAIATPPEEPQPGRLAANSGGGAVIVEALLAVDRTDHLEHLGRRRAHQRRQLLSRVAQVPMGLFHQLGDALRRRWLIGGLGHGFLLPDALDGSHGSRSSERGRPPP